MPLEGKTGGRKLTMTTLAMGLITTGFIGTLLLSKWGGINPNDLLANYTAFSGAIIAALTAFVGSNAFVHAKGKDPNPQA
jgi:hypothetical protein